MADEQENIKLNFDSNAKQVSGDVNKLSASIESSTSSTNENNQAVEQGNQSYKTFKTQLREANQELQKQIQLTGESSEETIKAAQAVAELRDQMGFAQDLTNSFNPDQKMKALGAATQVAGTGLQGVTAGMALFGGESEDTQKQLLKVQAAMAFSDAISNLSNLGDQWQLLKATISASSVATKANAAATGLAAMVQNVFTGSVNTSSAGFKGLKLAIAGTGIGLLVVGLAMVITNFDKIQKVVLKVVPGLASVGKFIGDIVESVTDFIGVTSEADRAIDRMKANADASLALNKKFLAEHGSQLDEFTKQKLAAKDKYNEAIKEDGADQVALAKELNRELAAIEYSRGDESRKIQSENAQKAKEEAEKRRLKAIEDAKKEAEDAKKVQEENLAALNQFQIDTFNAELEQKKEQDAQQVERLENITSEVEAIEAESAEKEIKIEESKKDQKKAIRDSQDEIADKGIGLLNLIAGKNKAIQKAAIIAEGGIAVARAIRNTVEGNAGALAKSILQLGPIAGPPAAAPAITMNTISGGLSVATTVAQTAKALQSLGGGGGISGGSISAMGGGSATPPTVAFNNTAENQIGQSVASKQTEQPPLKVYVAESDISDAQNNVKVLVEKNTF